MDTCSIKYGVRNAMNYLKLVIAPLIAHDVGSNFNLEKSKVVLTVAPVLTFCMYVLSHFHRSLVDEQIGFAEIEMPLQLSCTKICPQVTKNGKFDCGKNARQASPLGSQGR